MADSLHCCLAEVVLYAPLYTVTRRPSQKQRALPVPLHRETSRALLERTRRRHRVSPSPLRGATGPTV